MRTLLGCSGWSYRHWKGFFYPKELPQREWFRFYAERFRTVELNATFYRFPTEHAARMWHRTAPNGFTYTIKASRIITHLRRFHNAQSWIKKLYAVCGILDEKLGCILFQLPPSMQFDEQKLDEIIDQLDLEKRNVLEFRHPSWFRKETYETLRKHNIMFCAVSSPRLPDTLVKTAQDVYIRFHGKSIWYAHNYTEKELRAWVRKIQRSKAKTAYAYFNNDFAGYAPKNCLKLTQLLR